MIEKIWLYPPLAIARLGTSEIPVENYEWGPNDLRPRGTGKTTINPVKTLHVAEGGTVVASVPEVVHFKDDDGFRPVCPFFELHGEWITADGLVHTGPITTEVLDLFGLSTADLSWTVHVANLKPYHNTEDESQRIEAKLTIKGSDTKAHTLKGVSPQIAGKQSLVPEGRHIPLGRIQVTRPTAEFVELRLRFTPPNGQVHGPTNLGERVASIVKGNPTSHWVEFALPEKALILNPAASWCNWAPEPQDLRTVPPQLYAFDDNPNQPQSSLGLVDDVSDGIVTCELKRKGKPLHARARIVVSPPDYAPDRRPPISLADGFKDRVDRDSVRDPGYAADLAQTSQEVRDILERAWETMGLMNLDAMNDRVNYQENQGIAQQLGLPAKDGLRRAFPWPMTKEPSVNEPLPLTEAGRQRHHRFVSIELFNDMMREQPELLERFIRGPMTADLWFDKKMPALMRGSDGYPLHLSRRQWELLKAWVARLRSGVEEGS